MPHPSTALPPAANANGAAMFAFGGMMPEVPGLDAAAVRAGIALLEEFPALIWRSGTDGGCHYFNQSWLRFTGRTMEQELGDGWAQGVHSDDIERVFRVYRTAFDAKQPFEMEYRLRHHKGRFRWIVDHGRPLHAADGAFLGYIGACYDITDRVWAREKLRRSEEMLAEAQSLAHVGSWAWDLKTGGVTWSDEHCRIYGIEPGSHPQTRAIVSEFIHRDDREYVRCTCEDAARSTPDRAHFSMEHRIVRPDGGVRLLHCRGRVVFDAQGEATRMFGTSLDLTDRKRAEEALRRSEERYALAARGANDGLWDWDFEAGKLYLSPRWQQMLGYEGQAWGDSPQEWLGRVHAADRLHLEHEVERHLAGETAHFGVEHRVRHQDGSYRWMLARGLAVRDQDIEATSSARRMAGSLTDVTERREAEAQMRHNSLHDALTDLPNRASFLEQLEAALHDLRATPRAAAGDGLAVFFLDFDRFKHINDSLGHDCGDQLLIAIAKRLREALRTIAPGSHLARLGGDEFTILLPLLDSQQALEAAEQVRARFDAPFDLGPCAQWRSLSMSASIGIAHSARGQESSDDLLRHADTAMYRAKARGRSRCEFFDEEMRQSARRRSELEADLRRLLASPDGAEDGELQVFYQPIIELQDGRVAGFEGLVRWNHPRRGLLSPGDFLPMAEETDLIVPLDRRVLRQGCRRLALWLQNEELKGVSGSKQPLLLTLSLNLSSRHFAHEDCVAVVAESLREAGVQASWIQLELGEAALDHDDESAESTLSQLRELGVGLSMDNFGTGHASLSRLHRLGMNALKIDGSLVRGGDSSDEIVRAMIGLADALKIDAVAEGIETREQFDRTRALGCRFGQGEFFSPPLPAREAAFLLWNGD